MRYALVLLAFVGCTSSVQVVDSIPTPPINIDTTQAANVWTFRGDSAQFIADILERYCTGIIDGNADGTDYTATLTTIVKHDTVYVAKPTIRLIVRRDTVRIPIPKPILEELARLRENQEQHGFFDKLGWATAGAGVLLIIAVVVFVALSLRRLLPPLKF